MLTDYLVPRNCACPTPFDVRRNLNRFFSELSPDLRGGWPFGSIRDVAPASNVWETQDDYFVEMAAPGLGQDDVSLSMVGSELTIQLETPTFDKTDREGRYWRQERARAASTFSLTFPSAVDAQDVSAELENGVLLVKIPKAEKAQVKKICVNKAHCGKTNVQTHKNDAKCDAKSESKADAKACKAGDANCSANA